MDLSIYIAYMLQTTIMCDISKTRAVILMTEAPNAANGRSLYVPTAFVLSVLSQHVPFQILACQDSTYLLCTNRHT